MLFHTLYFLLFFLILYPIFWLLPDRFRKLWLFATSIFFYGVWSIPFLFHFLGAVLLSYGFVVLIHRTRRRIYLVLAISINLANLAFFKYAASFLTYLSEWFGIEQGAILRDQLGIILPLAISFYTFQIIAFIVDVWRKEVEEVSFLRFAVFILFFPQLIAGPIMRHRHFLYQMDKPEADRNSTLDGIALVLLGIVKKVFIGDAAGEMIAPVWSQPSEFGTVGIVLAVLGFSAQIYGDFSGYTDMARGLAKMLGYEIPENFYSPYFATSFSDLWRRWHVTLSTWLQDYLYIPLGGNRVSKFRYNLNILIVMSLGGLWHGDTYTYFLWGLVHGIFLALERLLGIKKTESVSAKLIGFFYTTIGWLIGVVFFRAADLGNLSSMFGSLFHPGGESIPRAAHLLQLIALVYVMQWLQMKQETLLSFYRKHRAGSVFFTATILFYLLIRMEHKTEQFIYFQF